MGTYASKTNVSTESSRAEIERTLRRYGADQFMSGWNNEKAMMAFVVEGRQVRFVVPMPDCNDREFTHTPERGLRRTPKQQEEAYEQARRQRWRALSLVIKAKLEAVDAGIVTFEEEFAMHFVLPGGHTVADEVLPAISEVYATGQVRPLLQIGSGR